MTEPTGQATVGAPPVRQSAFVLLRRLRLPLIVLVLAYAVAVLGFTLIPGVDPQGRPWQMSFFHAFYFVSFLGSTIGLGEIPYPFTDAQRMWATGAIYATVLAWLYGIGTLISVVQDPMFRRAAQRARFTRGVRRIAEPFYLVCGYDDTGSRLARGLARENVRFVVVDDREDRIDALEDEDFGFSVPGIAADATDPRTLQWAGVTSKWCIGVLALSGSDDVNVKVSITAKLLNERLIVISVARNHEAQANLASFGTDHIINPYDTFAERLAMAILAPSLHVIYECLTTDRHRPTEPTISPPKGRWIVCGYGRFGRSVRRHLESVGITVQLIEPDPEAQGAPEGTIKGLGTVEATLIEAGIKEADAIVAGSPGDADNLSIIVTARELNKTIFTVARQNEQRDTPIYRAARLDVNMLAGYVAAAEVQRIIRAPQLSYFLRLARRHDEDWAHPLLERLCAVVGQESPDVWSIVVTAEHACALVGALRAGRPVTVGDLLRDPRDRSRQLRAIPLLQQGQHDKALLPDQNERIEEGDRVLWCGRPGVDDLMRSVVRDDVSLAYILTGDRSFRRIPWPPVRAGA